jgi:hypothetical protein
MHLGGTVCPGDTLGAFIRVSQGSQIVPSVAVSRNVTRSDERIGIAAKLSMWRSRKEDARVDIRLARTGTTI